LLDHANRSKNEILIATHNWFKQIKKNHKFSDKSQTTPCIIHLAIKKNTKKSLLPRQTTIVNIPALYSSIPTLATKKIKTIRPKKPHKTLHKPQK
jgi:hypothetical protein